MPMSHVSVAYLCPCCMSNLKIALLHVTLFIKPRHMSISKMSHFEFKIWLCLTVEFRDQGHMLGSDLLLLVHGLSTQGRHPPQGHSTSCRAGYACADPPRHGPLETQVLWRHGLGWRRFPPPCYHVLVTSKLRLRHYDVMVISVD